MKRDCVVDTLTHKVLPAKRGTAASKRYGIVLYPKIRILNEQLTTQGRVPMVQTMWILAKSKVTKSSIEERKIRVVFLPAHNTAVTPQQNDSNRMVSRHTQESLIFNAKVS